jgi:hypothetical protein
VRHRLWIFILLMLMAVVCAAAVPPTDVPETNYNEVDTPVNQAPPVEMGVRFVRPMQIAKTAPGNALEARWDSQFPVEATLFLPLPKQHDAHSIQNLLCTLLI